MAARVAVRRAGAVGRAAGVERRCVDVARWARFGVAAFAVTVRLAAVERADLAVARVAVERVEVAAVRVVRVARGFAALTARFVEVVLRLLVAVVARGRRLDAAARFGAVAVERVGDVVERRDFAATVVRGLRVDDAALRVAATGLRVVDVVERVAAVRVVRVARGFEEVAARDVVAGRRFVAVVRAAIEWSP